MGGPELAPSVRTNYDVARWTAIQTLLALALVLSESRMNKPLSDPTQPYRSLLAGYNEAIRASDMKANIAFLFAAFMMGSVLFNYTYFPSYLPIELVLLPFLIVYFCLFMVLLPRYPKRGAKNFRV